MKSFEILRKKVLDFVRSEIVFCVAAVLAVISSFIIPPTAAYAEYIDFRVLALLFCLMLVVAGFRSAGVFEKLLQLFLKFVKNTRQLVLVLVLVCFILSMWITNDVALITFVPFAIMVLTETGNSRLMPVVIALQTVAANLGSMCTPVGNPQNLYLYTISGMSIIDFIFILLPYTVISLLLILAACFLIKPEPVRIDNQKGKALKQVVTADKKLFVIYAALFIFCMLTVLNIVHYMIMLIVVFAVVLIFSPKLFKEADYMLLLTFIAFFVFVGNIKQVQLVNSFLGSCVAANEVVVSVAVSQFISNVPAAVLLSGFTDNYAGLIIGTNIGGLGTIIASMASLISYKLYVRTAGSNVGKYMLIFTAVNIIFLAVLSAAAFVL